MRDELWRARRRAGDAARHVMGPVGRGVVAGLTHVLGAPRLAAWSVAASTDREATLGAVTEELTPLSRVTPAEIVGNYLRGYVLLGRGGSEHPELIFRHVRPRAIIDREHLHIPSRVRSYVRSSDLRIADDASVVQVLRGCQERPRTWVVEPVVEAWDEMAAAGFGKAWSASRDGEVVAGIWALELGRTFGIMSMFHRENRAGAVLLASLLGHLGERWDVVDVGSLNDNFARYGAFELSPAQFAARVLDGIGPGHG